MDRGALVYLHLADGVSRDGGILLRAPREYSVHLLHMGMGLGYPFGGVRSLVDLVGPACSSEILFSARRFSADEALAMGLVNRIVPNEELEKSVRELASQIAANAPLTVRAAKAAIGQVLRDPDQRDLAHCNRLLQDCFESEYFTEGKQACMEKRQPVFKGR